MKKEDIKLFADLQENWSDLEKLDAVRICFPM